jgi:chromosome segregation ATPase
VAKLAEVRKRIAQLVAALAPPAAGAAAGVVAAGAASAPGVVMVPQAPPKDLRDAEMQTEDARSALRRGNTQKALDHAAETEKLSGDARRIAELEQALDAEGLTVEQLDDQLYQLKQEYERVVAEKEKNEVERAFLATQVDTLVKEKRTDVVKRYEEDIERLKETHSVLNEKIATLTAEKVKNEARIKELLGRVDMAEAELKERDSKDVLGLDVKDEKVLLKGQISKQREQIILKAKAATAGWDAAAHSDERLDVEVERAFKKGFAEERQQHIEEMKALNAAIEVKEVRVTELLVAMAEMERKVSFLYRYLALCLFRE